MGVGVGVAARVGVGVGVAARVGVGVAVATGATLAEGLGLSEASSGKVKQPLCPRAMRQKKTRENADPGIKTFKRTSILNSEAFSRENRCV